MYSTMTEERVLPWSILILFVILGSNFFHIYLTTSIDILEKVVSEVDKKGYQAIVVTCDDPTTRVRDNILPLFLEASNYIDRTIFETVTTPNVDMHDVCVEPVSDNSSMIFKGILSPPSISI